MNDLITNAAPVLIALIPFGVVALSGPRRRLNFIREEAKTLAALPRDHPAYFALERELAVTVSDYVKLRVYPANRVFAYLFNALYAAILGTCGAALWIADTKLGEDVDFFGRSFWQGQFYSLAVSSMIAMVLLIVLVIARFERGRELIRRVIPARAKDARSRAYESARADFENEMLSRLRRADRILNLRLQPANEDTEEPSER